MARETTQARRLGRGKPSRRLHRLRSAGSPPPETESLQHLGIRKILPETTKLTENQNRNHLLRLKALKNFTEKNLRGRSFTPSSRLEFEKRILVDFA
jgi:hypothetical protein